METKKFFKSYGDTLFKSAILISTITIILNVCNVWTDITRIIVIVLSVFIAAFSTLKYFHETSPLNKKEDCFYAMSYVGNAIVWSAAYLDIVSRFYVGTIGVVMVCIAIIGLVNCMRKFIAQSK